MREHLGRSRWAAIGAAVAVTLGAGGLITASAAGTPSSLVPITPVRVLDTRLPAFGGAVASATPRDLDVTGTIATVGADGRTVSDALVVPDGATAIVANVTIVGPTTPGFVAVRPGTATGAPTTSNLNATAAGVIVPNAVTVEVPTTGSDAGIVELWFQGTTPGATADLLVDIVGYYAPGAAGPKGDKGDPGTPGATGPAGPAGPQGDAGPALPITDKQLAMLRWDLDPAVTNTYGVGDQPFAITFDGASIWVGNYTSNNFTKITPDGRTATVGPGAAAGPYSMIYTGSEIKIGYDSLNIGTLDPNGTTAPAIAALPAGPNTGIAFDGTNTWIVAPDRLVKRFANGSNTSLLGTGCTHYGVVFDGAAVWISCQGQNEVRRIDLVSFATLATVPVGAGPRGMAYTGRYLWVANFDGDTVSRIDTRTNAVTTFPTGAGPQAIAYDGSGVWITNFLASSVTHIRADGTQETIPVGLAPAGIVFDGRSVWVANSGSDTVTRIPVT